MIALILLMHTHFNKPYLLNVDEQRIYDLVKQNAFKIVELNLLYAILCLLARQVAIFICLLLQYDICTANDMHLQQPRTIYLATFYLMYL